MRLSPATSFGRRNRSKKSTNPAEPYTNPDGYRIYAVLLENENHSSVVIQSETVSWDKASPDNLGIKGDSKFRKEWGTALNDFTIQYRTAKLLGKNIPLDALYELISRGTIDSIFKNEHGWPTFYDRYSPANGFYSFSPRVSAAKELVRLSG